MTTSFYRSLSVSLLVLATSGLFAQNKSYGDLPLSFEPNRGQAAAGVQFIAHGKGYGVLLQGTEAVLLLARRNASEAVRIQAVGSRPVHADGELQLPGVANYFRGNDPARWINNIPTFGRVRFPGVYPGVDLLYYGTHRQLEYDFVVQPQADPAQIALAVSGAARLGIAPDGDLLIDTQGTQLRWHAPVAYQLIHSVRVPVAARYELQDSLIKFSLGVFDRRYELVIDPVLAYSSYLGGDGGANGDVGNAIVADAAGNAYIAGYAASANFPAGSGSEQSYNAGIGDAFVAKLNSQGTAFVYSTYLGGGGDDTALALAVNAAGEAYVTGQTGSGLYGTNPFPTTPAAYRRTPDQATSNNSVFVSKLSADGSQLLFSTYISGKSDSSASGIAIDPSGNAYVVVNTASGFPTTSGAYQRSAGADQCPYASLADGAAIAITKLSSSGSKLIYSTYLGRGCDYGAAIAVNSAGEAYVTGHTQDSRYPVTAGVKQQNLGGVVDVFVTRLNAAGDGLVYSTFLGGQLADFGNAIALDSKGYAYVAGATDGYFPVTSGAYKTSFVNDGMRKGFIAKLSPQAKTLNFSTYISGDTDVALNGLAIDPGFRVYVTGYTNASNYPVTSDAVQSKCFSSSGMCLTHAVVTELNSAGSGLLYSSYFGANDANNQYFPGNVGQAIAVDPGGNFYITGRTSGGLRTTAGSVQKSYPSTSTSTSAFVAKFSPGAATQVVIRSPRNGSKLASPVRISASAAGSQKIRALQLYVDGTKCSETHASNLDVDLPMDTGLHRISVQAMDAAGAISRKTVSIYANSGE